MQTGQVNGRVGGVKVASQNGLIAVNRGDFPCAIGVGMLLVGGVVFQWQFDGFVVEVNIVVLAAQFNTASCAYDKRDALLMGLACIGCDGSYDLVIIAGPAAPARNVADVLLEQFGWVFDGEVALFISDDSCIFQVLTAIVAHAPPP